MVVPGRPYVLPQYSTFIFLTRDFRGPLADRCEILPQGRTHVQFHNTVLKNLGFAFLKNWGPKNAILDAISDDFILKNEYLRPFRRYSPVNFQVVRNRAKFCMFLAFFGEDPPKNLYPYYLIENTFHYRAKFPGDRPTELGDYARGKKEKSK